MKDNIRMNTSDVFDLDTHPELKNQHLPEEGKISGSPLWVNWRDRTVYFSGKRQGNSILVTSVNDRG